MCMCCNIYINCKLIYLNCYYSYNTYVNRQAVLYTYNNVEE